MQLFIYIYPTQSYLSCACETLQISRVCMLPTNFFHKSTTQFLNKYLPRSFSESKLLEFVSIVSRLEQDQCVYISNELPEWFSIPRQYSWLVCGGQSAFLTGVRSFVVCVDVFARLLVGAEMRRLALYEPVCWSCCCSRWNWTVEAFEFGLNAVDGGGFHNFLFQNIPRVDHPYRELELVYIPSEHLPFPASTCVLSFCCLEL